jgi:hypothetical protein
MSACYCVECGRVTGGWGGLSADELYKAVRALSGQPTRRGHERTDVVTEAEARRRERAAFESGADWAGDIDYSEMSWHDAKRAMNTEIRRRYPEPA